MALQIIHEFQACDESKQSDIKEATVVVGSTGVGKSMLIKLYCGDNVVIGHGVESQTTKSALFQQTDTDNKYWLDSQGANDSKGAEDEQVLCDILKTLYKEQISKIKVVWIVSGDMCREKKEFQLQAKFIQSLGDNVWNTCLIIKKMGRPHPKKMDGVLAAANRYGANIKYDDNQRLFGFTALNHGDISDDCLLEELNEITDVAKRAQKYMKYGYLTNEQIITNINHKLSQLQSLRIEFIIKKCVKCGIKGDPRFIYAPCHGLSQSYHPQSLIPCHNAPLIRIHIGVVKQYPILTKEMYHPQPFYYSGAYRTCDGVKSGWYPCCVHPDLNYNKTGIYNIDRSIVICLNSKTPNEFSGCTSRMIATGYESKWSCCDGIASAGGCREQFQCCDRSARDPGCQRRYSCCDHNEGHNGCQIKCQSCHRPWGNGPGCTKTTVH
eukprot:211678_1